MFKLFIVTHKNDLTYQKLRVIKIITILMILTGAADADTNSSTVLHNKTERKTKLVRAVTNILTCKLMKTKKFEFSFLELLISGHKLKDLCKFSIIQHFCIY